MLRQGDAAPLCAGRLRRAKPPECADLVTEMREIKHPFQAGIKAQRGIDY